MHISEIYLNNIVAHLPGSIYWKDRNGVYLGCNDFVANMAGLKNRFDVIGKTDYELPWKEYADELQAVDQKIMNTGLPLELEEYPIFSDGRQVTMLTNKAPLRNDQGDIIGIMGTSLDITKQRQAEERERLALIKETRGKVEAEMQLRQAVTIISGSIVHDLSTPLCIMNMQAQNIKKSMPKLMDAYHKTEADLPPEKRIRKKMLDYLSEVGDSLLEETNAMSAFIRLSLKSLSKAITGDTRPEDLIPCSMDKCIDQTVRRYPFTPDERKLIQWDRKDDFKFMGNEILMVRILFNLFKNSLEQIRQHNKGKILITTEIGEKENLLRVKDTAGGAPPEVVEHLFDGYQTTKKEGTGIGLSFSKKTLKDFGGDITCHSEFGDYIEFILVFPKLTEDFAADNRERA
jgi:PAS domain S-box-containing protein